MYNFIKLVARFKIKISKKSLQSTLGNNLTFKFDNKLIHSDTKNDRVKRILLNMYNLLCYRRSQHMLV